MQDSAKQIQVFYELKALPGKAAELREIAEKMVAMNATEEPGTLVYNVYFNDDETLFTYLETYSDSETGLFHAGRFAEGEYVGQILERTDGGRLCFYGDVSNEFKNWAKDNGFEPVFQSDRWLRPLMLQIQRVDYFYTQDIMWLRFPEALDCFRQPLFFFVGPIQTHSFLIS